VKFEVIGDDALFWFERMPKSNKRKKKVPKIVLGIAIKLPFSCQH
jgi:hypothetical protein